MASNLLLFICRWFQYTRISLRALSLFLSPSPSLRFLAALYYSCSISLHLTPKCCRTQCYIAKDKFHFHWNEISQCKSIGGDFNNNIYFHHRYLRRLVNKYHAIEMWWLIVAREYFYALSKINRVCNCFFKMIHHFFS